LDHRVRNTLATIQSILTLAEKSGQSKAEFADAVRGRVDALARAHGLLIQTQWRGASLARLVTDELQPYGSGDHARLQIAGADLLLQPKAAVLIALVIHELATNAAKYGALSVRRGGVAVAWGVEGNASERRLRLTWAESGGPAVEKPLRRGFGSKLIESSLVQEFDADVRLDFAPAGVRCTASIPLRLIAAENVALAKAEDTALFAFPAQTASLAGARILLVEDDALIGLDLKDGLEEAGAKIVGPIARLDRALALAATDEIDAAVLDVNLGGERVFPLADRLVQLGVPFAFLTGYDKHAVFPDRYRGVPALQKPVSRPAIAAMVERLTVRQAAAVK
jgi:two-component sensor histidine kinase/CheY-like chemotaxis protein